MRFIFLLLLAPFSISAQARVYMEVLPNQSFELVQDSLFPSSVALKGIASFPVTGFDFQTIHVEMLSDGTPVFQDSFPRISPVVELNDSVFTCRFGLFHGLNHFNGNIRLKDDQGNSVSTLSFSSNE
jgi:hypothetical protein